MTTIKNSISFSEWQVWNSCQQKWYLDYIKKLKKKYSNVFLGFGNAVHFGLEYFKDPTIKDKTLEIAINLFTIDFCLRYESLKQSDNTLKDEDIDEWLESGRNIFLSLHKLEQLENAEVLFVEHPLEVKIDRVDDLQINFKGYIDIVIKTFDKKGNKILYLCDYKTCFWGWNVEKKTDENVFAQLRLYKHFFCKKFNVQPELVKTAYVLLKRSPPKNSLPVEWLPISVGNKTMMRTVLKINQDITEMNNTKQYKKNLNNCIKKYGNKEEVCPYYGTEHCDAKK